mgnify:CR=1 FL=1
MFYPILEIEEFEGFTNVFNFPPNNWELKKKTKPGKKPSSVGSKTEDDSEESQVEVSADSCNIM